MDANIKEISALRISEHDRVEVNDAVVKEFSLTIILNGQELITLLCSPTDSQYLAAGFLQSQRLIMSKEDILSIVIDEPGKVCIETRNKPELSSKYVLTSSGAKNVTSLVARKIKTESQIKISADQVFSLMEELERRSEIFKVTGGTHCAALCDVNNIKVFSEDIGRHNAIDKVFGQCLLHDIDTKNSIVIFTGRVSSEILLKIATRDIPPIFIARNGPTDVGIELANDLGITLIGFARGTRMNVYTNDWRIVN